MRFIASPRGQIEVYDWGAGDRAIVLLHAAASSPRALSGLAEMLSARGFRVVAPSLAGYDHTGGGADADPIGAHVAVARAVLATVDTPRAALFGHSMGGLVALRTALAEPTVTSVFAYEPVAFGVLDRIREPDAAAAAWDRRIADQLVAAVESGDAEPGVAAFYEAWSQVRWEILARMARRSLVESASRLAAEVASVSRDRTPASAYAPLGDRLTLLRGSHSPVAARLIAGRIASAAAGSTLIDVAGTGHMAPVMQPDAIANAIVSTLKPAAT